MWCRAPPLQSGRWRHRFPVQLHRNKCCRFAGRMPSTVPKRLVRFRPNFPECHIQSLRFSHGSDIQTLTSRGRLNLWRVFKVMSHLEQFIPWLVCACGWVCLSLRSHAADGHTGTDGSRAVLKAEIQPLGIHKHGRLIDIGLCVGRRRGITS